MVDCWKGGTFPVAGEYQPFSDTWGASRSGGRRTHKGTDVSAASGTPLVAVLPGRVRFGSSSLGGNEAFLETSCGTFYYAHLSRTVDKLAGQHVEQGTVIGAVGSTGNSSGPHLHFGWLQGPGHVNPYTMLASLAKSGGAQGVQGSGSSVGIPTPWGTVGVGAGTLDALNPVSQIAGLPGVQALTELAKAGLAAAAWLQNRDNWLRILGVIAAAGLTVAALVLIFGDDAAQLVPHPAAQAIAAAT